MLERNAAHWVWNRGAIRFIDRWLASALHESSILLTHQICVWLMIVGA
jgi:hypothetical protein